MRHLRVLLHTRRVSQVSPWLLTSLQRGGPRPSPRPPARRPTAWAAAPSTLSLPRRGQGANLHSRLNAHGWWRLGARRHSTESCSSKRSLAATVWPFPRTYVLTSECKRWRSIRDSPEFVLWCRLRQPSAEKAWPHASWQAAVHRADPVTSARHRRHPKRS